MTYYISSAQFTVQDDLVPGPAGWSEPLYNYGLAYSLAGHDKIIGKGSSSGYESTGLFNNYDAILDTGDGKDTITGAAWSDYWGPSIYNLGSIETGNDEDYISTYGTFSSFYNTTYYGALENYGMVSLGEGNDMLDAQVNVNYLPNESAIWNWGTIEAGNGDDIILSNTTIYNEGVINTGNGNDTIITFTNDGGFNGSGNVFLGNGEDYLKGFGNGNYHGGDEQDTLVLPPGFYTIGIGGYGNVSFGGNGKVMQTFGFEKLNHGAYDFTSLYDGQTISI
jgi:hypothetical protein